MENHTKTTEDRFIDLEIRIGQQEYAIDVLNRTIYRQQGKIDQLEATLKELAQRMAGMQTDKDADTVIVHERPPHY